MFGRHVAAPELVKGVYAATYGANEPGLAAVRDEVECYRRGHGRAPRIFICKLGQDGHDRGQDVVGAAFSDLGFEVILGPLFQTPDEAAREAVERHADIVAPSSLAAGHLTLVPALRKALVGLGRDDLPIVIGGVVPPQDHKELYADGVAAIFGPGTALPAAALKVLDILAGGGRRRTVGG
ncbi:MAG TPA: cobalamin-dependent protein [Vicinamibacterales bacterium]|nr:cobalamin-dependent protein [Vicinamibacterales bacterium]